MARQTGVCSMRGANAYRADYVTPEMYGAIGGGVIDDTLAILAMIADMVAGDEAVFTKRYLVSQRINLAGKEHITFRGSDMNYTGIVCNTHLLAVWDLRGARYINHKNFSIETLGAANAPHCIMRLGRSDAGSYGHHRFERFAVTGYATENLVYSICSEVNSYDNVFFTLTGGGAANVFYTSQLDDFAHGDLTESTNLSQFFKHFWFWNLDNVAGGACIKIDCRPSAGDIVFRDGYLAGGESFVRLEAHNGADGLGPYVFDGIRGENYLLHTVNGLYVSANGGVSTVLLLNISNCNFADPNTWCFYGEDDTTISRAILVNNQSLKASSFFNASSLFMNDSYNNVAFRGLVGNSTIIWNNGYTLSTGPNRYGNTIIRQRDIKLDYDWTTAGTRGVVITSPDGTQTKRIYIDNAGTVQVENE